MGNVIVVTSGKGGVGKTTITANLGCALAKLGEKVCLIDADIGLKNLDIVLGLENRIVYTMIDVVNGKVSPQEALVKHKMLKNLYLLPASQIATKEMISPNDMKAIVKELIPHFDYIIIDSPAGIERGFRNAVAPAERVLVVTTPELPAVSDADRVIGLLENFGFSDEKINVIINRFKPHMVKKGEMLTTDDIKHTLSLEIIAVIPDSEDIIVASNTGIPVSLNGNSRISKNFENLARRIRGEGVPLENDFVTVSKGLIDTLKDFFSKLKRG
jgi:septum site-determining protein MinD